MLKQKRLAKTRAGVCVNREHARTLAVPARSGRDAYYRFKRFTDLVFAASLLIALSPLFILIAVVIRLETPGPVFFRQVRVAAVRRRRRNEILWTTRTFRAYKFRSMYFGADESAHKLYIEQYCRTMADCGTTDFKLSHDPRVTRVGRLLRRTSLDELPQLFNVLAGHMSLVGPRPVPPYEVAHYKDGHFERFTAMSGLTGLWQVKGRGRVPFEEMIRMDTEYAHSATLWLDLKILCLTVPAVVWGHGAR